MTPQTYIESQLQRLSEETTAPTEGTLEERIFKIVMSKKFRKFAIPPESNDVIKKAIAIRVRNNEPIQFGFPFGAYKLWRLEEAPEPDFAELFALMYYARWIKPIADIYTPGVSFAFCSDEIMVERLNNIPKIDTAQYAQIFKGLMEYVHGYLPQNVRFSLKPVSDLYTSEEFTAEVAELMDKIRTERSGKNYVIPDTVKKTIELNVRKTPMQERDPHWLEKVELEHEAMMRLSKRRPQYRAEDVILAFPTPIGGNCVPIGTTKTSVAKFWVGVGALQKRGDTFIETILSPSQLEHTVITEVEVSLGTTGKNLSRIRIIV